MQLQTHRFAGHCSAHTLMYPALESIVVCMKPSVHSSSCWSLSSSVAVSGGLLTTPPAPPAECIDMYCSSVLGYIHWRKEQNEHHVECSFMCVMCVCVIYVCDVCVMCVCVCDVCVCDVCVCVMCVCDVCSS